MKRLIAPSLLSADFGNLNRDIEMINKSQAHWFHLDIMDGVFVPNISFGFPVIKYIKKAAKKPLDVHLMIIEPDKYIEKFHAAGADILTVHFEACTHLHRTIQAIKSLKIKAGVSLNPHTPVHVLENIIADLDLVLIMSVNPGFGGQKFIEHSFKKIMQLKKMINTSNSKALIEVDGGVDNSNAKKLISAGADVLVAGNYIFGSKNPEKTISDLNNIINPS
ncbi:MAG TPA: ribulose-phosphate 3-epimerase [Bacteroidales bacterium]|nr:MAG: ribulose-phosphate 3-epimerase [Bacteroidetes bacterium GWF2_35_48]OFY99873.1 MAG: ribulose-phosphate 3-epimerase [Bacteroidetes bacterium RIFOXYC12_FULL_35_7]HBX50676.1 ribulose-phosphate 3-epimerase [Bacteroidales bacterium]